MTDTAANLTDPRTLAHDVRDIVTEAQARKLREDEYERERQLRMMSLVRDFLGGIPKKTTRDAYAADLQCLADYLTCNRAALPQVLFMDNPGVPALEAQAELNRELDGWVAWMRAAEKVDKTGAVQINPLTGKPKLRFAPKTICRKTAAVNSLFAFGRHHGCTMLHPSYRDLPAAKVRDREALKGPDDEGVAQLLAYATKRMRDALASAGRSGFAEVRDVALIRLLCIHGLRRQEVCGLTVGSYDAAAGVLRIVAKGAADSEDVTALTLADGVRAALDGWLAMHPDPEPASALFVGSRRRSPLKGDGLRRIVRRLSEGALGRHVRTHGLRHSAITAGLNAVGGDIRRVRLFARHADISTTVQYDDQRGDPHGDIARDLDGHLSAIAERELRRSGRV